MASRSLAPLLLLPTRSPASSAPSVPSGTTRIWEDGTTRKQTDGVTTRITE